MPEQEENIDKKPSGHKKKGGVFNYGTVEKQINIEDNNGNIIIEKFIYSDRREIKVDVPVNSEKFFRAAERMKDLMLGEFKRHKKAWIIFLSVGGFIFLSGIAIIMALLFFDKDVEQMVLYINGGISAFGATIGVLFTVPYTKANKADWMILEVKKKEIQFDLAESAESEAFRDLMYLLQTTNEKEAEPEILKKIKSSFGKK